MRKPSSYVNAADIRASDSPCTVVQKLDQAFDSSAITIPALGKDLIRYVTPSKHWLYQSGGKTVLRITDAGAIEVGDGCTNADAAWALAKLAQDHLARSRGFRTDRPIAYMYRVHLKGQQSGGLWSEVTEEEYLCLASYQSDHYSVERAELFAPAISIGDGRTREAA